MAKASPPQLHERTGDPSTRRRWWQRESRVEQRAIPQADVGWMVPTTASGMAITPHSALRIIDVLACVRLLAESASVCPLISYRRTGETRERSTGALRDLLERPAPATSQANLISSLVGALAMRGNGFLGKFRDVDGNVAQLVPISPDLVTVSLAGVGGEPVYTLLSEGGVSEHTSADILHFKGLSVDGIYGVSPVSLARESLGLAAALTETSAALFANQAIPRGVLTVPSGDAEDDVLENLREGFAGRHGGPQNAGRVAVLTTDVQFTGVSLSPADAELLSMRKLSSTEVARLFRVPPHLIGAEGGSSMTYSNVAQELDHLYRLSLAPLMAMIEQAVSNDRDLCARGEFVEFLLDAQLRPDPETRSRIYQTAIAAGYLTVDDVRQRENLPPLPTSPPTAALPPPTEITTHA